MRTNTHILGIDPGLRFTGWGVIAADGSRLRYLASGRIATPTDGSLSTRLRYLSEALDQMVAEHTPDEAAVEETFVNANARSALKLGQARGVCLVSPARAGLDVAEYAANVIKKAVVGAGHASKDQISAMVARLLPTAPNVTADEADALAVAICHASHRQLRERLTA